MTVLEEKLGLKIRTIAYPVGGYEHFNTETQSLSRQCGYEAAFSYTHEINLDGPIHPYNIKRIVPPETLPLYVGTMALPRLYVRRRSIAEAPISIMGGAL